MLAMIYLLNVKIRLRHVVLSIIYIWYQRSCSHIDLFNLKLELRHLVH